MTPSTSKISAFLAAFAIVNSIQIHVEADVCLIFYQLADNGLEPSARQDTHELIQSTAIRDPTLTTWVYFDGRNYVGTGGDITTPLQDVYYADGTAPTTKETGSTYMTWNHELQKMVINATLQGEQNGEDPQTVYGFVTYALRDCVKRGSDEYMALFSSHGGGFRGFGLDDNKQRKLIQSNDDLADALQRSLADVPGAPGKFHVIGFDACLMQSLGAIDDYSDTCEYFLASQAMEPGQGWAYGKLSNATSVLTMSRDLLDGYIHDVPLTAPKTLSLVDTQLFGDFLAAWESLFAELTSLLLSDADVFSQLHRAQILAVAFNGVLDDSLWSRSELDIGSYLSLFRRFCTPSSDTALGTLFDDALRAYTSMFVSHRVGDGTYPATGMSVTFPLRSLYNKNPGKYDSALFENPHYATKDVPNFLQFMKTFYRGSTHFDSFSSICTTKTAHATQSNIQGKQILSPAITVTKTDVQVECDTARTTEEVIASFAIQVPLDHRKRRNLRKNEKRDSHNIHQKQPETLFTGFDHVDFYGGELPSTYFKPKYIASWDRNFYSLSLGNSFALVYVTLTAGGESSIPVIYFNESIAVSSIDFPFGTKLDDALEMAGAKFCYMTFPLIDFTLYDPNLSLYTYEGSQLIEIPQSAGGHIVPLSYTNLGILAGGGFGGGLLFPWREDCGVKIKQITWDVLSSAFGSNQFIIELIAYDYKSGANGTSSFEFQFDLENSSSTWVSLRYGLYTTGMGLIFVVMVKRRARRLRPTKSQNNMVKAVSNMYA